MSILTRAQTIAQLNDRFRENPNLGGGMLVMTAGVSAQGADFANKCLAALRNFDTFTEDNDPHGEHDFGSLLVENKKLFWKIDYFQKNSNHTVGAEEPDSPLLTDRVLTIMLCDEY